ncbi:hypothetical protein NC652_018855 [Populus alba x Populus x berolinensis]|nr:hypothetical protein NC652_018855 [Populus alba x Populus x berolinensis]
MPNGDGSHYSGSGVRNRGKGSCGNVWLVVLVGLTWQAKCSSSSSQVKIAFKQSLAPFKLFRGHPLRSARLSSNNSQINSTISRIEAVVLLTRCLKNTVL